MNLRIVFLDFDDVLNSITSWVAFHPNSYDEHHLDRVAVGLVKRLVEVTEAYVVISSSWRNHFSLDEIKEILARHGWENAPIIGQTDDIAYHKRSLEINKFLWDRRDKGGWDFKEDTYVIIDDAFIDPKLHKGHIVKVEEIYGFTIRNFIQALIILDPFNSYFEKLYTEQPLLTGFDADYYKRLDYWRRED